MYFYIVIYKLITYFLSTRPPPEAQFNLNVHDVLGMTSPLNISSAHWAADIEPKSTNAYPELTLIKSVNITLTSSPYYILQGCFISNNFYNDLSIQV